MMTLHQQLDAACRELMSINIHWTGRQLQADERDHLLSQKTLDRITTLEAMIRLLREEIDKRRQN